MGICSRHQPLKTAINCYGNQGIPPHALGLGYRDCSVPSHPHTHLKRVTGSSRGCIVWAQLILYNRPSSLGMGDSAHTPPSFTGNLATMVLLVLWREAALIPQVFHTKQMSHLFQYITITAFIKTINVFIPYPHMQVSSLQDTQQSLPTWNQSRAIIIRNIQKARKQVRPSSLHGNLFLCHRNILRHTERQNKMETFVVLHLSTTNNWDSSTGRIYLEASPLASCSPILVSNHDLLYSALWHYWGFCWVLVLS